MPQPDSDYSFNGLFFYPVSNVIGANVCGYVSANFVTVLGMCTSVIINIGS